MHTKSLGPMKKQVYEPRNSAAETVALRSLGLENPDGICSQHGRDFTKHQVCRNDTFSLVAVEAYRARSEEIGYTRQEGYVKINFWLSGKHTTILDGYGQYDHDGPEVFITTCPEDVLKVDVLNRGTPLACLALCLLPEFFHVHMGIDPEELPDPLRTLVVPKEKTYAFHQLSLTPDLVAATRAILAAPFAVRRQPIYAQAKAMELMCLLINRMETANRSREAAPRTSERHLVRLFDAREILIKRYSETITLERVAKEVGLNRIALTSGFREQFGCSVHDFLQKVRMERAYELVQDQNFSIKQVAEAVGYTHYCNFSTAFHAYFGCPPRNVRGTARSQPRKKLIA